MKERLERLRSRIDNMSLRERAILFGAVVVVLFVLWDSLLMQPLEAGRKAKLERLTQVRDEVETINQQTQQILARRDRDPNEELRRDLARTEAAIGKLEASIGATMGTLIAPREMARVLEDVLTRQTGLRPVKVESLPAVPVISGGAATGDAASLYRHRLQLTLAGGYLETVAYLRQLEALPWSFYWDSVTLDANDHSHTVVVITVSTLGLREGWIGV